MSVNKIEKQSELSDPVVRSISYFTLFRFATPVDKTLIAISLLFSCGAGLLLPFNVTVLGKVLQSMADYVRWKQGKPRDNKMLLDAVHQYAVANSAVGFLMLITVYISQSLMNVAAINQVYVIRQEYLKAIMNQDLSYFDKQRTGDFASKMADDILKLKEGIGEKLPLMISNIITIIGSFTLAFIKGWKMTLICISTMPVTLLLVGSAGWIADRYIKRESAASGKASAVAEEVLSSVRTVYAFSGQQKEVKRYKAHLSQARQFTEKKDMFIGLSIGVLLFCTFCSYAFFLYFGIFLVLHEPENYDVDVMITVFNCVLGASATIGATGEQVGAIGVARGAGAQLFFMIDNKPKINPLLDKGLKLDFVDGCIELKDVKFHYPSRPDVPILKGVSLSVKRGQAVALVGLSGSGKSTVIQLICRYYDVVEGSVSIDGHDVRELSVRCLRSIIGLVGQEPVLFSTTVRENIRYGCETATNEEIEEAARHANAHNFIMNLPKGYETLVGESGASLSGGQKQRVAIARALVRDPRLLLLDEATSALDATSEAVVQDALDKASQGRTTLIIAHRLSTIRKVHFIYVFKDGEIIESGSHDNLMTLKGHYYEMVSLQKPADFDTDTDKDPALHHMRTEVIDKIQDTQLEDAVSETENDTKLRVSSFQVLLLNKPEWKYVLIGVICSIINGCGMPAFAIVFGSLFGKLPPESANSIMAELDYFCLYNLVIGFIVGLANFVQTYYFGMSGALLTERLRRQMFEQYLRLEMAYYDDRRNSTGALCARLSGETAHVRMATGERIGTLCQAISAFTVALCIAVLIAWKLALIWFLFLPIFFFAIYIQGLLIGVESEKTTKAIEESSKTAMEAIANIRTVASLGREPHVLEEYKNHLLPHVIQMKRSAHVLGLVIGLSRSLSNFSTSAMVAYGGSLIVTDELSHGSVLTLVQALQLASAQSINAFAFAPDVQRGHCAASRILAILRRQPRIRDPDVPAQTPFVGSGEASFKAIRFRYPCRPTVPVLNGLNLEIPQGKTIALVGDSGCGKSTVIQLLERYYDPNSGQITMDSIPLNQLRISEFRHTMGLVSQEPVLFDRTIAENIAYGDNTRTPTDEEVKEAALQANIHTFIISLPLGYDTNVGSKGTQLSGGQKQRIAIARALLRKPRILLLDEATSALDTQSEKVVQDALDKAKAGRTCVTIAHRLSTIRDADLICVLHQGRVAESGTHADLINTKGLYYALTRAHV